MEISHQDIFYRYAIKTSILALKKLKSPRNEKVLLQLNLVYSLTNDARGSFRVGEPFSPKAEEMLLANMLRIGEG
jgi:type I restriction-modification system DNA methylase subunit